MFFVVLLMSITAARLGLCVYAFTHVTTRQAIGLLLTYLPPIHLWLLSSLFSASGSPTYHPILWSVYLPNPLNKSTNPKIVWYNFLLQLLPTSSLPNLLSLLLTYLHFIYPVHLPPPTSTYQPP